MKLVVLDGFTLNLGDLNWLELNSLGKLVVYDRPILMRSLNEQQKLSTGY